MTSFKKIIALTMLFLTVSLVAAYGQSRQPVDLARMTEAAQKGDTDAQMYLGITSFFQAEQAESLDPEQANDKYTAAVHWLKLAAEKNEATAQFLLGVCYQHGKGVSQNPETAIQWYTKGAENGDSSAQFRLGLCYSTGNGVNKNEKEALKWFFRSAQQNNPEAQYLIGCCYEQGFGGLTPDLLKAWDWYKKAMYNGYQPAAEAYNRVERLVWNQIEIEQEIQIQELINNNPYSSVPSYTPTAPSYRPY